MDETTIATITLARNLKEERAIARALSFVKSIPLVAADGGSRPSFIDSLHQLGAQIVCPQQKGLIPQVKASLRAALDASDAQVILYTEPDKRPFFEKQLRPFLAAAGKMRSSALVFAARDQRSFRTFPEGQRHAEGYTNHATAVLLGKKADYCYGPILLSRAAVELALDAPEHLGWGWRFWLLGRVAHNKLKFSSVELPLPCPAEQRGENTRKDQVYRITQSKQNLEGLFLGME